MVFSSLLFLFRFLPLVLLIYFIVPKKFRNAILFFSSLFFYAWGEPVYVLLMVFSTLVDFTHGILVHHFKKQGKTKYAKLALTSAMAINLCLLGFFKYTDFLIQSINSITGRAIPLLGLALPIGISFYTFQTMSYTIDIYRGDARVQKNIISFGTYVALFPQLIAGPIVQYNTIAEQLNSRRENQDEFSYGVLRFMCGLGKKVLLANNIGLLWSQIQALPIHELSVMTAWLGTTAFAFQLYFDFSGYSDMAIGLGHIFGFRFLENFNYPYMASSITDFWRRWHISLGSWFRDYVYIPLGGNRKGLGIQIRNIAIVWLLTGIWHGASWNFVVWGVYFGLLLILEKLVLLKFLKNIPKVFAHLYTIFFVWISWVIFAFDSFSTGISYIKALFGMNGAGLTDTTGNYILFNYLVLFTILIIACTNYPSKIANYMNNLSKKSIISSCFKGIYIIGIFIIVVAYLVDATYNPFLYFRF